MSKPRPSGSRIFMSAFPNARSLWQTKTGTVTVEAFGLNGQVIIVQEFDHGGWDAYLPAAKSNRIDATLLAIGDHCGVEPERLAELTNL